MSGRVPEILEQLCSGWDEVVRKKPLMRGLRERPTYERQAALILGLTAHTFETARLVQEMATDRKLSATTMPLIRACLESSVTAMWVAQVDDAAEALGHVHSRQEELLFDQFRSTGDPTWAQLLASMEPRSYAFGPTNSNPQAKSFEARCKDLEFGSTIYALYRVLSGWCHPSVRLADEYVIDTQKLETEEGMNFGLLTRAKPVDDQDTWLFIVAMSALWASRSFNFLTQDRAHRSALQRAARELGVPLHLKAGQTPPKQRTRISK